MGYMTLLLKYVNIAQLMYTVNKLLFSSTINDKCRQDSLKPELWLLLVFLRISTTELHS